MIAGTEALALQTMRNRNISWKSMIMGSLTIRRQGGHPQESLLVRECTWLFYTWCYCRWWVPCGATAKRFPTRFPRMDGPGVGKLKNRNNEAH